MRAIAIALLAAAASRGLAKCKDDKKWRYERGPLGDTFAPKSCKDVAEKPDARCDRVSEDGVSARYACCATCSKYDAEAGTKLPIFFQASNRVSWDTCKKTCEKKDLAMPCVTSKKDNNKLQTLADDNVWLGYTTGGKDPLKLSNWKWRSGCKSKYTNWEPGEPNNIGNIGEYCAESYPLGDRTGWNDEVCNGKPKSDTWLLSVCYCQTDDPAALAGKGGGKAPSKAKCKKDDKTWRDKDDGTTCKAIKKIKNKKARKKACKRKGENAAGDVVTAKEACCKKACK